MYKNKIILQKREFIPPIMDSMIPVDGCQNRLSIINFTTDDMTSNIYIFSKNKIKNIYLTESM